MIAITVEDLNLYYGDFQALIDINMEIKKQQITAMIGPSGCGKSTLLRCFNRMNDLIEEAKISGRVIIDGKNIYDNKTNLVKLRRKVGMVFQRPNPFPSSIYENIAFTTKIHGQKYKRSKLDEIVEESLKAVMLWDVLRDKLKKSALALTLEQQQRLCIARLLPVKPEIILMDEPCSALDPIATQRIEELLCMLKKDYTILIVTHNMQQAARISDETAFMLLGRLIEFGKTEQIFTRPMDKRTEDYIVGRYG